VTLAGYLGCYPPTDPEEFVRFAGQLAHRRLYDLVRVLEPVSPPHAYRDTTNSVYRYNRLTAWPRNLVVLGDAYCSLNPFYGQGMTASLVGCELLSNRLRSGKELGLSFQKQLTTRLEPFLKIAVRLDGEWAGLERGAPGPLARIVRELKTTMVAESYRTPRDVVRFTEARNHLRAPIRAVTPLLVARTLARTASKMLGRQ
jgi:hypothetical protein